MSVRRDSKLSDRTSSRREWRPRMMHPLDDNFEMHIIKPGSIKEEYTGQRVSKRRSMSVKWPWKSEDIKTALLNTPGGAVALALIPDRNGEILEKVTQLNFGEKSKATTNGCSKMALYKVQNEPVVPSTLLECLTEWTELSLLIASWLGNLDVVKTLLERKTSVSARDRDGRTPLHLAACANHLDIVKELLEFGASPTEWDFQKEFTPLHCAAAVGNAEMLRRMVNKENVNIGFPGYAPLYYAVRSNALDCVAVLLGAGASPTNPQVYTETPLHLAASLGFDEILSLLLRYGADIRVQFGAARLTPLHVAAEEGNSECVRLLLEAGAAVDARNSKGQTGLHLAAFEGCAEVLKILIDRGADINAEDDDGRTPLLTAVAKSMNGSEPVQILTDAKADVNKADKFGYTPLHLAALNENSIAVSLLIESKADVTARTKGGISALSFIFRRTPDVIACLTARLDEAISLQEHELGDTDCILQLDFRQLVPDGRNETDLMLCFVEVGHEHLLNHPLCESFLYVKWLLIRKFFMFSLIFHLVFVVIFSTYVLVQSTSFAREIVFWPMATFTVVMTCKEIFQTLHGICIYAKRWENWLQWGVIVACAIILISPNSNWIPHVAAVGILLAWTELMVIIGRFPMFGLYIQMFAQVAVNFFKFAMAYGTLVVGFAFGFTILHNNYKSFTNPAIGFLKTIIMMSGELEFEDVFFSSTDQPLMYTGTPHVMLFAFVVLVTIILTNLMVGLAVSDIQELRRSAGLDRLIRRAELVAHMESMLFSKFLNYCPRKLVQACRKGALFIRPHHCALLIKPNDPRDKRLPRDIVKSVYQLICQRGARRRNVSASYKSLFYGVDTKDCGSMRYRSIASVSDLNKHQLGDVITELKICIQNMNSCLETLPSKIGGNVIMQD